MKEFEKRQKSVDPSSKLALMSSMMKIKSDVIDKKKRAKVCFQIRSKRPTAALTVFNANDSKV